MCVWPQGGRVTATKPGGACGTRRPVAGTRRRLSCRAGGAPSRPGARVRPAARLRGRGGRAAVVVASGRGAGGTASLFILSRAAARHGRRRGSGRPTAHRGAATSPCTRRCASRAPGADFRRGARGGDRSSGGGRHPASPRTRTRGEAEPGPLGGRHSHWSAMSLKILGGSRRGTSEKG